MVHVADEVRQSLRNCVQVLLNCGAENFVGRLIVAAKGVEAVLQKSTELGDGGGYLGAQAGEVCCSCFSGAAGFFGEVATYLGQAAAEVGVERFVSGVEAG